MGQLYMGPGVSEERASECARMAMIVIIVTTITAATIFVSLQGVWPWEGDTRALYVPDTLLNTQQT